MALGKSARADYSCDPEYSQEGSLEDSDRILGKAYFVGIVRIDKAKAVKEITRDGKKRKEAALVISPVVSYGGNIKPETVVLYMGTCYPSAFKEGELREIFLERHFSKQSGELLFLGHVLETMNNDTWEKLRERNGFYDWAQKYKVECLKTGKEFFAPYGGALKCEEKEKTGK